jgi:hypothetical protein
MYPRYQSCFQNIFTISTDNETFEQNVCVFFYKVFLTKAPANHPELRPLRALKMALSDPVSTPLQIVIWDGENTIVNRNNNKSLIVVCLLSTIIN